MGLFISRAAKMTVDKSKMATSYFLTGACFFLIACNAGLFIFLPNLLAPLAIILSNAITVILMLVALRPINRLLKHEFEKKAEELVARRQEEIALRERVSELETANQELERKIDSWAQTAGVPANLNLSFKVETMTYDKSGYIVKEEPLERFLEDPAYGLTGKNGLMDRFEKWMDSVSHPGERKVLYIGKYYIKASIGLDFTRIKFSVQDGVLTLFGVRFTKLNDLAIVRDEDGYWLIDKNYNLVFSEPYEMIDFTCGREDTGLYLTRNHVKVMATYEGKVVEPFVIDGTYDLQYKTNYNDDETYDYALDPDLVVYIVNGWEGLMDKHSGKVLTPAYYTDFTMISKNLIHAELDKGYDDNGVVMDRRGNVIRQK